MTPSTRKAALAVEYKRYFTGLACVRGHVSERRTRSGECIACRKTRLVAWQKKNPEKWQQHCAKQYLKNTQKVKAASKSWSKNNPVKVLANTRAQQTKRRNRNPKWLTPDERWMIEQAYELAALRTKMLGFPWQVDHVLPLQGKHVSGLHTPYNMQVIPGVENARKDNR